MTRTIAIAIIVLISAVHSLAAAEIVRVAVPDKGAWNTSFTELGLQQGFFQDENLDVIIVRVADEAALEKALISGDADIAVAAYLPDILTAWIKGAPVRIISAQATGAPDIFWFARAGGPIRSMKDLPGQPVGFGSRGSLSDFVLHALLNDAGVNDARLVATGTADNGILMVLGAELAASWGGPVAAAKDLLANEVTLIGRGNDSALVRKRTTRVNAASAQFLAGHRALAVAFLKAYKKSVDWAYSSEAALKAYAKVSDQSLEFAKYIVSEFASKASNQIDEIKGEDGSLAELSQSGRAGTALSRDDVRGAYDMVLKSAP